MLNKILKKTKIISIYIFLIGLLFLSVLGITIFNKNIYYSNIKNNVKDVNTSLLNNVYIANVEEEPITEKVNNIPKEEVQKKDIETNKKEEPVSTIIEEKPELVEEKKLDSVYVGLKFVGSMTAYGKDCCGSDPAYQGITASGYDLKQSLTYNDSTYGNVRIVASDRNFKLYSIIRVNDPIDGSYNVIVLDRAGSVIGLNKTKKFDLAVESELYALSNYGVHKNITFEVLRVGK